MDRKRQDFQEEIGLMASRQLPQAAGDESELDGSDFDDSDFEDEGGEGEEVGA